MADNASVATRAPESDAQEDVDLSEQDPATPPLQQTPPKPEDSTTPASTTTTSTTTTTKDQPNPTPNDMLAHDTAAQTGPSMGTHCTTDRPLPTSSSRPTGEMTHLGGIETYISKPSSYPHNPSKLLLLLTGGTGIHSKNNQLQADAFTERGFVVIMPDQFQGDAAPNTAVSEEDAQAAAEAQASQGAAAGILERIKVGAAETAKSFLIDMWLARHTAEKVLPVLQKVLEAAREEFADAVANGGGVYGVGYCFGAKYILLLCGMKGDTEKFGQSSAKESGEDVEKGEVLKGPELKVGVIAHGTLVTAEDIEAVKRPMAMACVKGDSLFPDEIREQGRSSLIMNGIEHEIRVFEGVPHGFAVIGDYRDERIQSEQQEAFEFMAGWLEAR